MDIFIPIVLFIIFFILFSICGYCCKRNKQGVVYGANPPMVTTTTTYSTSNAPYPVMEAPMPQPMQVPPTGYAPHAAYPPTTPYPPAQGGYPPTQGGYPPAPGESSGETSNGYPMPMPMQELSSQALYGFYSMPMSMRCTPYGYYPMPMHLQEFSSQAPQGYYPMPMPMQGGYQGNTPYPPMPMPGGAYTAPVPPYPTQQHATHQQPPSYAEAVTQPVQTEVYAKQAAYNPNYQ